MSEDTTLAGMCLEALARDPTRQALEFEGTWIRWGELRSVADQLERLIRESGVQPGVPIVFVPHNRPAAVAAFLGILAQARSVRMVYAFQAAAGIARDLQQLETALVVASAEVFSAEVRAALQALGAAAIALNGMVATPVEGLERRRADQPASAPVPPEIQILTSGTTGKPKRFGIAHEVVARHIVNANRHYQRAQVDLSQQAPMFSYYPLGNISGIYGVVPTLLRGHRVVLVERFSVELWRDYLRRHRPERASLPPAGVQMVLDADVPADELRGVRSIATGAAPLDLNVQRAFEARYKMPILISYGATEFAGPVASMTPELHAEWGDKKFGSAGRPSGGAQLRAVSPETGAALPPGEEGLLEVIAPHLGPDWIRTSDLAVVDPDGFLFLRGRADGAIMRGGFKLLPETIERAILLHPAVSAVAVVGVPDARLGQVPGAAVELKHGVTPPSVSELEQHVRDHVYATHVPAVWRIVEELPRTGSLKIDGAAVRGLFDTSVTHSRD